MIAAGSHVTEDDLAAIAADVWGAFLLAEDDEVPVRAEPGPGESDLLHAAVEIDGAWTGRVVLTLAPGAAARATRTMLALPDADDVAEPDVADAIGELANMVSGHVKSLVPAPSTLGLPRVGTTEVASGPAVCVVDLDWSGAAVRVGVWTTAGG